MTTIFSDGFEVDFSMWTGTVIGTGDAATAGVAGGHHGNCGQFDVDANTTTNAYAYKTFASSYTTIFSRICIKFTDSGTANGDRMEFMVQEGTTSTWVVLLDLHRLGGTDRFQIYYRTGASSGNTEYDLGTTVDTNHWYCIELETIIDNANGEYHVWIDGTERITLTGLDTDNYGNINQLRVGIGGGAGITPTEQMQDLVDCCVVADAYIGLETAGLNIPVAMHHYNMMRAF